ncbi:hypothetical protein [Bacillus sp. mrc49]|uniref:hypothetical protein n=1 Tax=Bacillus sp. mrc49 TaxID=2054913 RepID=UPI000C2750BC|nr:hypothetical protein [Bacillus sp. mrc49]PJN91547.1 hypothetical protein CVN76_04235 [Bacillus sp. mrc49]
MYTFSLRERQKILYVRKGRECAKTEKGTTTFENHDMAIRNSNVLGVTLLGICNFRELNLFEVQSSHWLVFNATLDEWAVGAITINLSGVWWRMICVAITMGDGSFPRTKPQLNKISINNIKWMILKKM